jgi:Xaa-Pro aminopeptidase
MVKEPTEVKRIRAACQMTSGLLPRLLEIIRPGEPETVIAGELEFAARVAGAQQMAFPTIVASGPRSALPHGRASAGPIPANGFVVCDFGVILAGYCSDMTRTMHVGRPSAEARSMYEAVQDAQQAALDAVKPGATVGEVDLAARKLLQSKHLAKYFTHSTGHGVGLEIHECPRVAAGQKDELRPGMVITIEPGVYLPGKSGVRIEDTVVVTETGCEVLTPCPKAMIVL